MKPKFFLSDVDEMRYRVGFVAWLWRLANIFKYQIHFSPSLIWVTDGLRTLISAGVLKSHPTSMAVMVDKETLLGNEKLARYLCGLKVSASVSKSDESEVTFIFDPTLPVNKNTLLSCCQHYWWQVMGKFLNCEVSRVGGGRFELRHQPDNFLVGHLEWSKSPQGLVIEADRPFVAEGIAYYFFGSSVLDRRFSLFFSLPELAPFEERSGEEEDRGDDFI